MKKTYDIFISHASCDTHLARELRDILVKNNFSVFLAADENRPPLNSAKEWKEEMTSALFDSERLVFIVSDPAQIKPPKDGGNGCWVHYEVDTFHTRCTEGQASDYFGIFVGGFDKNSYTDSPSIYAAIQPRQNLSLEKGASLSSIEQAIYDRTVNAFAKNTLLLSQTHSKTADFIKARQALDSEFSLNAIDDDLIPLMKLHYRDGDERTADFDSVASVLQNNNIVISAQEGGSGKTTLLTKLFFYFYNKFDIKSQEADNFLPIFIDAKLLSAENNLIIRYISQYLFENETAMSEHYPDEIAVKFSKEFKNSYDTPDYLLLIDGLNEVPFAQAEKLEKEIAELMSEKYPNVRVALSHRGESINIPSELFHRVSPMYLRAEVIDNYLIKNSLKPLEKNSRLRRVLSLPMYLKLYVSMSADGVKNQGDLLSFFTKWQLQKITQSDLSKPEKAQHEFFLLHLLPCFSYNLVYSGEESSFVFKFNNAFFSMLSLSLKELFSRNYKMHFGEKYFELVSDSNLKNIDQDDLAMPLLNYYTKVCRILRKQSDGSYSYIHQIYRDYFAAVHIANQLTIALDCDCENLYDSVISQKPLSNAHVKFIAQILGERTVFFNRKSDEWDYACNNSSVIYKVISAIRKTELNKNAVLISNLISILKFARMGDLSNCDFGGLDLSLCDLTHTLFSRFDKNGCHAASFEGAVINEENLIFDGGNAYITAAAFAGENVMTLDTFGNLKLWAILSNSKSPLKIISGLNMPIKQILFSEKEKVIYAVCNNSILKIEIPEKLRAQAVYEKVFESREPIREISFSQSGELLFTTGDNPLNPKPITNPDAEDVCSFKGIYGSAAINKTKDQIVLGHFMQFPTSTKDSGSYDQKRTNFLHSMRYSGIHKYQKNSEGKWEKKNNTYHTILYSFYNEIKNKIIDFGLYNHFYYQTGHHYFDFVHDIYEDRSSKFDSVLYYTLNDLEKIGGQDVFSIEQKVALKQIADKYAELLNSFVKANFPLMSTEGKIINSLCYSNDGKKLLVSAVFDSERTKQIKHKTSRLMDGKRYKSNIVELDLESDSAKFIYCVEDNHPAKAVYGDNYILAYGRESFSVFDLQGRCVRFINNKTMDTMRLFKMPQKNSFILLTEGVIYEFDKNLKCIKAIENHIGPGAKLHYENGKYYLVNLENSKIRNKIDLENGFKAPADDIKSYGVKNSTPAIQNRSFRFSGPRLLAFEDDLLCDQLEIKNRLLICGCNFKNISGSLKDSERLLSYYGAVTDSFVLEQTELVCGENYDDAYSKPEAQSEKASDYKAELKFKKGEDYPSHEIYVIDVTRKIERAFAEGRLGEFDKDVMKWAVKLRFFTAEMIYKLITANVISAPDTPLSVKELDDYINSVFRQELSLLSLAQPLSPCKITSRIYTTNKPFGDRVGQILCGNENAIPSSVEHGNIISILTVNNLVCRILSQHRDIAGTVKMYPKIETDAHFMGAFSSDSYFTLGDRAIIAEYMNSDKLDEIVILDKIARRCAVAKHFEEISCDSEPQKNSKPPLIILIAENEQICKEIIKISAHLFPDVKRIYTYEDLFASGCEDCYFFEKDGALYTTSLEKELH